MARAACSSCLRRSSVSSSSRGGLPGTGGTGFGEVSPSSLTTTYRGPDPLQADRRRGSMAATSRRPKRCFSPWYLRQHDEENHCEDSSNVIKGPFDRVIGSYRLCDRDDEQASHRACCYPKEYLQRKQRKAIWYVAQNQIIFGKGVERSFAARPTHLEPPVYPFTVLLAVVRVAARIFRPFAVRLTRRDGHFSPLRHVFRYGRDDGRQREGDAPADQRQKQHEGDLRHRFGFVSVAALERHLRMPASISAGFLHLLLEEKGEVELRKQSASDAEEALGEAQRLASMLRKVPRRRAHGSSIQVARAMSPQQAAYQRRRQIRRRTPRRVHDGQPEP
eukprot:scaffold1459_cov260-Pinguiococcus_pyrenoidosus.AAC.26